MADLTKMSPKSGRIIAEDGTVKNLVDLLGGGTPVGDEVYPLEKMSPSSGRVIGEDGKVYNVVDLLEGIEDEIKDLSKLTKWLGETTTPLYEGSTANPIVISGVSITATQGNVAKYQSDHFIFSEADTWQPYDDTLDVYTKDESDARYLLRSEVDLYDGREF